MAWWQKLSVRKTKVSLNPDWFAYISGEVTAVCRKKGWVEQIRRKTSARERPVSTSSVDDYEWKLIPSTDAQAQEAVLDSDWGRYFVVWLDADNRKLVLQHDTFHCGVWSDDWMISTYTEIALVPELWLNRETGELKNWQFPLDNSRYLDRFPPGGWLERILSDLTARFEPNYFPAT